MPSLLLLWLIDHVFFFPRKLGKRQTFGSGSLGNAGNQPPHHRLLLLHRHLASKGNPGGGNLYSLSWGLVKTASAFLTHAGCSSISRVSCHQASVHT